MNNSLLVVLDDYILSYIIEPNHKVYFVSDNGRIFCNSNRLCAQRYINRDVALSVVDNLKVKYDIEFSVERL